MQTLPIMDELEAALAGGTNARRIEMLTRITDLFVGDAARFTEAQTGVFDDIMVRLVSAIEAKARAKLAHRLAPIANAPLNTIHMLAFNDDIEVAATVLSQSERLDENALLANAGSKSQQHLFAIAQRKSLSEAVTDMLVERGDREVVHSVVKNSGARFSDAGFRMLVKRSAGDDDLATVVGLRSDIPHPHFLLLLEKASSAVRARLVAENPQAGAAVGGPPAPCPIAPPMIAPSVPPTMAPPTGSCAAACCADDNAASAKKIPAAAVRIMSHSPNVCRREAGDSIEHRWARVDQTSLRAWHDDRGPRRACRRRFLSSLCGVSSPRSHVAEDPRPPLRKFS